MTVAEQRDKKYMNGSAEIMALFKEFPYSNIYSQWQLIDSSEIMVSAVSETVYRAKSFDLNSLLMKNVSDLVKQYQCRERWFFLAAYHLLIQRYISDEESVVSYRERHLAQNGNQGIRVLASYYYFEEASNLGELFSEVRGFCEESNSLSLNDDQFEGIDTSRLPLFNFDVLTNCEEGEIGGGPVSLIVDERSSITSISFRAPENIMQQLESLDFFDAYFNLFSLLVSIPDRSLQEICSQVLASQQQDLSKINNIQERMKVLWHEVLDVNPQEIHADSCYFDLGGTSLNAFLLVNKIRSEFDLDINIRNIVEHSILKELSAVVAMESD